MQVATPWELHKRNPKSHWQDQSTYSVLDANGRILASADNPEASLIAAAPQLYAALLEANEFIMHTERTIGFSTEVGRTVRAALAKVEIR